MNDIADDTRPRLPRGVRLRNDPRRGWLLLAPETVFETNRSGAEILKLCNGENSFADMVRDLSTRFSCPPERMAADVAALLSSLRDKRLIDL